TLSECHQKLGLKPSDFISEGPPTFFKKKYGTGAPYLLYVLDSEETACNPAWKAGYYLLPMDASDALKALDPKGRPAAPSEPPLPVRLDSKELPPPAVEEQAQRWAKECQPLFFHCGCTYLELHLNPPWGFRRQWKARL